jgi:hypothetical protein
MHALVGVQGHKPLAGKFRQGIDLEELFIKVDNVPEGSVHS